MKYRHILTTGMLVLAAPVLDIGAALASDDTETTEVAAAEESFCPAAQFVCDFFPPLLGLSCPTVTAAVEGSQTFKQNKGAEIRVTALRDVKGTKFSDEWLVKHRKNAFLSSAGGIDCDLTYINKNKTLVEIPETVDCVAALTTSRDFYLEFFASNPDSGCQGWVECKCE